MSDALIVVSHLFFSWPDDTVVFDDLSFSVPAGHTGIVAPNGAGKSTLLELIVGSLRPSGGSITVQGTLGYLPQNLPLVEDMTVADVLGISATLKALQAMEAGDTSEEHFTAIGNDWDIEQRTHTQLAQLGIENISLNQTLNSLSGGQIVSLGLAAQLLKQPDVLLLDEPTNNLDLQARHRLYGVLENWRGGLLVVSHDRALLDRMDRIAELHRDEARFYGGNFTYYEHAVRGEQEVAEKNIRTAEQEVKREKRDMQQARERAARRASNAARNVKNAGLPKIVAGALKRRAQESAGKGDDTHAMRVSQAQARLDEAEQTLRDEQKIKLELPDTKVPAGRTVFVGNNIQVRYGEQNLFAKEGIDLVIRGPERIALTGPNGMGKSTLLQVINGDLEPQAGNIKRSNGRIAYLSQRLDLLDINRTVSENLAAYAPSMLQTQRMHMLARFLFRGSRIHLPVGVLSGGERLRATLACVLYAEPAPQLLLLDEPTNNLDLVSVAQLESALQTYEGAFVVVSHDQRFLANIGVNRWLYLSEGRLFERKPPGIA